MCLSASVGAFASECAWCESNCSGENLGGSSQARGRDDFLDVRLWKQGGCFNASALFYKRGSFKRIKDNLINVLKLEDPSGSASLSLGLLQLPALRHLPAGGQPGQRTPRLRQGPNGPQAFASWLRPGSIALRPRSKTPPRNLPLLSAPGALLGPGCACSRSARAQGPPSHLPASEDHGGGERLSTGQKEGQRTSLLEFLF